MRIGKVKTAGNDMAGLARHHCRQYSDENRPDNIITELSGRNTTTGAKTAAEVEAKVKELHAKITGKRRRDEVGLLDIMITSSGENGLSKKENEAYLKASKTWIEGLYGAENVVGVYFHRDETVAHLHAFVVPLVEKEVSLRQTREEKEQGARRTERKVILNAGKVTGGFSTLRSLQDDFHQRVSGKFGLERGEAVEITKAHHKRPSLVEAHAEIAQRQQALEQRERRLELDEAELKREKQTFDEAAKKGAGGWDLPEPKAFEGAKPYRERVRTEIIGKVAGISNRERMRTIDCKDKEEELNKQINYHKEKRELAEKRAEAAEGRLKVWRAKTPEELRGIASDYERYGVQTYADFQKAKEREKRQNQGRGY
jgi:hypothetical protein